MFRSSNASPGMPQGYMGSARYGFGMPSQAAPMGPGAPGGLGYVERGGSGKGGGVRGAVRGIFDWITENPETVATIAGAGLGYLGARKADKTENRRLALEEETINRGNARSDRELDLDEEEMRRRWARQEQVDPMRLALFERIMGQMRTQPGGSSAAPPAPATRVPR